MLIQSDNLLKTSNNPPMDLLPWLTHKYSLRDKLKQNAGHTQLEVLSQHWTLLNWWEKFTLGLPVEAVMRRNIVMYAQQTPCWFARTIVPKPTYQANPHFFDRLEHESLGDIIFNESQIKRNTLLNYAIDSQCLEYHWLPASLADKKGEHWVRLSVFTIADTSSFYLMEILLPGLRRITA